MAADAGPDLHYGGGGHTGVQTGLLVDFARVRGLLLSAKHLFFVANYRRSFCHRLCNDVVGTLGLPFCIPGEPSWLTEPRYLAGLFLCSGAVQPTVVLCLGPVCNQRCGGR